MTVGARTCLRYCCPIPAVSSIHLRIVAVVACLAAAAWFSTMVGSEHRVQDADAALSAGRTADAIRLAEGADGPTVRVRSARVLATAALQQGDLLGAERQIARALRFSPRDWSLYRDKAILLARLGDAAGARTAISRALVLNPRMDLPPGFKRPRGR